MARRALAALLILAAAAACRPVEEPLPPIWRRPGTGCEGMPTAPALPLPPLRPEGAAVACLPPDRRSAGVDLIVSLTRDGRPRAVEVAATMCDVVRPDGTLVPPYTLDESTASCLLDAMRDWRYAVVEDCWPPEGRARIGGGDPISAPGVWSGTPKPHSCG